ATQTPPSWYPSWRTSLRDRRHRPRSRVGYVRVYPSPWGTARGQRLQPRAVPPSFCASSAGIVALTGTGRYRRRRMTKRRTPLTTDEREGVVLAVDFAFR